MKLKNVKSLVVFTLILTCIVTALSGCKNSGNTTTLKNNGTDNNDPQNLHFWSDEPLEFTILYQDNPSYPMSDSWIIWDEIKKKTNVKLKPLSVPLSDFDQKRNILLASNEAPEIMPKTVPGAVNDFATAGLIYPVSDHLDKLPNYKATVKEWELEEQVDNTRIIDGKYYVLPSFYEKPRTEYGFAMRTDILEKNNLPIPKTYDQLYTTLKKLKEIYPDSIPFSDRWKMSATLQLASAPFKTVAGWAGNSTIYNRETDSFEFAPNSESHKALLMYFNKLVKEGLLDSESVVQGDDQAIRKLVNQKSFMISSNFTELQKIREEMKKSIGDNFKIQIIPMLEGPFTEPNVIKANRVIYGVALSQSIDKKPYHDKLLEFVDWLFYSEEGRTLTGFGVEGLTYDKVDGNIVMKSDIKTTANPNGTIDLRKKFGFDTGTLFAGYSKKEMDLKNAPEFNEFLENCYKGKTILPLDPSAVFNDEDKEQYGLISKPLIDYVTTQNFKLILTTNDFEGMWNDFVSQCNAKGKQKLIDMVNKAWQETKKIRSKN